MQPFRFGVTLGRAPSRAAWVAKAQHVEALGYAVLTVPDHLADFFVPFPALVSAAEATTHLRVGTHVLNNDFRHPVLVAREMAPLDLLTEGRLQLGLGAGYMHAEYEEAGFRFEAGSRRVARLAEAVRLIKGLCTGAPGNVRRPALSRAGASAPAAPRAAASSAAAHRGQRATAPDPRGAGSRYGGLDRYYLSAWGNGAGAFRVDRRRPGGPAPTHPRGSRGAL